MALVGAQVALVAGTLVSLTVLHFSPQAYEGIPLLDMVRAAVRGAGRAVARFLAGRGADHAAAVRRALGYVRSRQGLYAPVERLLIVRALQVAAIGFNVGALGNLLFTVAVSDVAFSWATTLNWTPTALADALSRAAVPWAWAWPAACPTRRCWKRRSIPDWTPRSRMRPSGREEARALGGGGRSSR